MNGPLLTGLEIFHRAISAFVMVLLFCSLLPVRRSARNADSHADRTGQVSVLGSMGAFFSLRIRDSNRDSERVFGGHPRAPKRDRISDYQLPDGFSGISSPETEDEFPLFPRFRRPRIRPDVNFILLNRFSQHLIALSYLVRVGFVTF